MNIAKIEESADDAATMCVWCEERVQGACKSHYDTLTCTHRVIVPTAEEWDSSVEARAAELHEGCQMPMGQARELAVSEASPDWYACGQDWGLADALTNGQSGDWVLDDIARAFAAGAQAGGLLESKRTHEVECQRVALEEQADLTAIHLARMQSALEQSGTRSADYLRKAIKWEARAAELATDAQRYRILRNCNMDVRNRLEHYGGDALDERLDALNILALGPNVEVKAAREWRSP